MQLNEVQQQAAKTAIYPMKGKYGGLEYCALGLAGEVGELCNKIKKLRRDHCFGDTTSTEHADKLSPLLFCELGDVLWYVAQMCTELGVSMESVAEDVFQKLQRRHEAGTIQGSGDER